MSTLNQPASHYGLSMILGGSEGTLWDLTNIYAGMARTLTQFNGRDSDNRYDKRDFDFANYDRSKSKFNHIKVKAI